MDEHFQHEDGRGRNPGRWVFLGFALVAGFFLFTEHRAHLFGILPYLLLLGCPLMHLFHGHGGHGQSEHNEDRPDKLADHSGTASGTGNTQQPGHDHRPSPP